VTPVLLDYRGLEALLALPVLLDLLELPDLPGLKGTLVLEGLMEVEVNLDGLVPRVLLELPDHLEQLEILDLLDLQVVLVLVVTLAW